MPPFEPSADLKKLPLRECFRNVRAFAAYYRPYKGLVCADLTAILVQAGSGILAPLAVYRILNVALPAGDPGMILRWAGIVLLLAVIQSGAEYVCLRWGHILGTRMEARMRQDLFRHLETMSFGFFDRNRTGQLMSRLTNDLTMLAETAHHGPEDVLVSLLTMLGAFAVMFTLNPKLALFAVIPMPFILVWGSVYQGRMRNGFHQIRRKVAEMNSGIENSIQGIREIKSFHNELPEGERFACANSALARSKEDNYRLMASFHAGLGFMLQIYTLLFVLAGALLIYWKAATFAEIMTFYIYSRYIVMPMMRLLHFTEQFQMAMASFERFRELMHEKPDQSDPEHPADPAVLKGEITFDHVSFAYPSRPDQMVLKDISLTVPAGTTAAIVGESGAGKSTIASLIPRFYDIAEGTVRIDGIPVQDYSMDYLHLRTGVVRQTPFLFDASIRENILFGRPDASREEVEEAARLAYVTAFTDTMPDGLDTQIGEHGVKLSGGQRQRISIARVFLKNPPILIFDEATSSLDNESEEMIQRTMTDLCRNRTSVIIAHRLSTIRNADRIFCVRNGTIVESGTHTELLHRTGSYYAHLYAVSGSGDADNIQGNYHAG